MPHSFFNRRMAMNFLGKGMLVAALSVWMFPLQASSVDLLAQFMKQARSGRADFTQVVTSPSRAGQRPFRVPATRQISV